MSLFYSNPPGIITYYDLCKSIDAVTQPNCLFGGFCWQLFAHFPPPTLAHFLDVVFFFKIIWLFLWHTYKCVQCQAGKNGEYVHSREPSPRLSSGPKYVSFLGGGTTHPPFVSSQRQYRSYNSCMIDFLKSFLQSLLCRHIFVMRWISCTNATIYTV